MALETNQELARMFRPFVNPGGPFQFRVGAPRSVVVESDSVFGLFGDPGDANFAKLLIPRHLAVMQNDIVFNESGKLPSRDEQNLLKTITLRISTSNARRFIYVENDRINCVNASGSGFGISIRGVAPITVTSVGSWEELKSEVHNRLYKRLGS